MARKKRGSEKKENAPIDFSILLLEHKVLEQIPRRGSPSEEPHKSLSRRRNRRNVRGSLLWRGVHLPNVIGSIDPMLYPAGFPSDRHKSILLGHRPPLGRRNGGYPCSNPTFPPALYANMNLYSIVIIVPANRQNHERTVFPRSGSVLSVPATCDSLHHSLRLPIP